METAFQLIAVAGIIVFLMVVGLRLLMWIRMPIHLRWELYPVAHEGKRAAYGGSYLEDSEWWTKPWSTSLLGELKVMVPEILFLEALRHHNWKLWVRSFPFHFGLYLIAGATALMGFSAVFESRLAAGPGMVVQWGVVATGIAGLLLGFLGAVGLIQRRLRVPELRDFSTPADFFNLAAFAVVFGFSMLTLLLMGPTAFFSSITVFMGSLFSLQIGSAISSTPAAVGMAIILMSLLLAYIPMTHMSHFIGKYFAYHSIRWNDEPNLRGGRQEAAIRAMLGQKVTWAAGHIRGNGQKTWVDVASSVPGEEGSK